MTISKPLSIYLDFVRATAAFAVLLYHAAGSQFGGRWLALIIGPSGLLGVVAFFVLSGLVIAYTVDRREADFQIYIINRLARIWSVAIPAIVLTILANAIGQHFNASIYPDWAKVNLKDTLAQSAATILFVNQLWGLAFNPPGNGPFWSLCYEFWYYVFFGLIVLVPGRRGLLLSAVAILIMGPKLWLLMPFWLAGVFIYGNIQSAKRLSSYLAWPMFCAPLLMPLFIWSDYVPHVSAALRSFLGEPYLGFSAELDFALLFGPLTMANLFASASLSEKTLAAVLMAFETPIRKVAGATLSIYLYHFPLLYMFWAILNAMFNPSSRWTLMATNVAMIFCTLVTIAVIAPLTESKKHWVRRKLQQCMSFRRHKRVV